MPEARHPADVGPGKTLVRTSPAPTSLTTVEIAKDYLHFSAAHFTIFSATERENLHGHDFFIRCSMDTEVGDEGYGFDYNVIKKRLAALCDQLDERVLLPELSPHLSFEDAGGPAGKDDSAYLIVRFADERIPFLPRDVLRLPIRNATIEEFAGYFMDRLLGDPEVAGLPICAITVQISSGPGQWASRHWTREHEPAGKERTGERP